MEATSSTVSNSSAALASVAVVDINAFLPCIAVDIRGGKRIIWATLSHPCRFLVREHWGRFFAWYATTRLLEQLNRRVGINCLARRMAQPRYSFQTSALAPVAR